MNNKNGRSKSSSLKPVKLDLTEKVGKLDESVSSGNAKASPKENKSRIYQSIVEELPFALLLSDESDKILMANRKTAALLGYSNIKELIAMNPMLDSLFNLENNTVKAPESQVDMVKHMDGSYIAVIKNSYELRLTNKKSGKVTVLQLVEKPNPATDDSNLAAESLQEYIAELEHSIYLTSHDLRTPLINIQGFSKELKLSLSDLKQAINKSEKDVTDENDINRLMTEEIPESLDYILSSTAKMESLLDGLIQLTKLSGAELEIDSLDMNNLIKEVVRQFEYKMKEELITIKIDTLPSCMGDTAQINRVFSNLISNAIKFGKSEEKCMIHISGWQDAGYVTYCVEDNGIGIDSQHQDNIFKMFRRLNPTLTKGEGLGLTISKKIVELHNGRMWVESSIKNGSRFYLNLPADQKGGVEIQPELLLLLAEPDNGNATLIKKSLRRSGIVNRIVHFADGKKLMNYFRENERRNQKSDTEVLMLLNTRMPGVDSQEILRKVKNSEIYENIPVIMITSISDKSEVEKFSSLGCDDFVSKPLDNVELLKAVQNQGLLINLVSSVSKPRN